MWALDGAEWGPQERETRTALRAHLPDRARQGASAQAVTLVARVAAQLRKTRPWIRAGVPTTDGQEPAQRSRAAGECQEAMAPLDLPGQHRLPMSPGRVQDEPEWI